MTTVAWVWITAEQTWVVAVPNHRGFFASKDGGVYGNRDGKMKRLKQNMNVHGYYTVGMAPTGTPKQKRYTVHRVIAQVYLPNPDNKPMVNHIDGNKTNNNVTNLEWVTESQNIRHAIDTGLVRKKKVTAVVQTDAEGNFIAEYASLKEAAEASGLTVGNISGCIAERRNQVFSGGYAWFKKESYIPGVTKPRTFRSHKEIIKYDADGTELQRFQSIKEASEDAGVSLKNFRRVCDEALEKGEPQPCRLKSRGGFSVQSVETWAWGVRPPPKLIDHDEKYETWAKLDEYPLYRISRDGRVYSERSHRELKLYPSHGGTRNSASVINRDGVTRHISAYRLVAMAYLPNPDNLPHVNHIDGNSLNDHIDNLEWSSCAHNSQHAYDTGLNPNKVAVVQCDREGNEIAVFSSIAEAGRAIGRNRGVISLCLAGKCKTGGGYTWKYRDERAE